MQRDEGERGTPSRGDPDVLRRRVTDAGFAIDGWDEVMGSIRLVADDGAGTAFIGSHAEVAAYVQAWERCTVVSDARNLQEQSRADRARMIHRSLLVLSSVDESIPLEQAPGGGEVTDLIGAWQQVVGGVRAGRTKVRASAPVPRRRTYEIVTQPQIPFRGVRLAIPDDVARHFDILDVRVGNRSMFPVSGAVPGEAFAMRIDRRALLAIERAADASSPIQIGIDCPAVEEFGRELTMDTCWQQANIAIIVQARSEMASRFVAVILGYTA